MSARLHLDPEIVAACGRELAGVAQRLAEENAALQATITGSAGPWGADESASVFAVAYQAVLGQAMVALGSYTEQLGFAAATLVFEARAVVEADEAAAADLYAAGGLPGA
ncbi:MULTISPECIES: PE domain-containing protein [Actinoplanes]|uniref:PE domain-containing protein n=1 Tax=Actinoplanes TaxID=1865 RepID=UPI0012F71FE2|nr:MULTISPECIES: PE domain-containing protein [Actinoplanes]